MALTKCPECSESVSTEAISCPHCGFPLKGSASQYRRNSQGQKARSCIVDEVIGGQTAMNDYVRLRRREEQLSRETYDPILGKEMNPQWGYIGVIIFLIFSIGWFLTFSGKALVEYKRSSVSIEQSSNKKDSGVIIGWQEGAGAFGSMVGKPLPRHYTFNWKEHLAIIFLPSLFGAGIAYFLWLRWQLVDKKLQEREEIRKKMG